MEEALAVLADAEPDHDLALLHAALGKVRFFLGELDQAAGQIDIALEIAEALWLPDVLSEALNTKALILDVPTRIISEGFWSDLVGCRLRQTL